MAPIWAALPAEVKGRWCEPRGAVRLPAAHGRGSDEVWMVASWNDAHALAGQPVVYVEHGAGQTYAVPDRVAGYAGSRGLDHVVLFICPRQEIADRWAARYSSARAVGVGCPKMDRWLPPAARSAARSTVAFTWHFDSPNVCPETVSALRHYQSALSGIVSALGEASVRVVGTGHPRLRRTLGRRWGRLGVEWLPFDVDVFEQADLLVADNTSLMYEFASLDRPVVAVNSPTWRRGVHHGLRFWDLVPGPQVNRPDQLVDVVLGQLDVDSVEARAWSAVRRSVTRQVYAHTDDQAARRAAAAIMEVL